MFQLFPDSHNPTADVSSSPFWRGKKYVSWFSRVAIQGKGYSSVLCKSDDDEEAFNNAKNRRNYLKFVPLDKKNEERQIRRLCLTFKMQQKSCPG